mmetsp:Transcript_118954/g.243205  ORF Transcript_118954/g.243205 Transcript_118954/m.243205 type:complete len:88 (+) Transcript_118954:650-913(+)
MPRIFLTCSDQEVQPTTLISERRRVDSHSLSERKRPLNLNPNPSQRRRTSGHFKTVTRHSRSEFSTLEGGCGFETYLFNFYLFGDMK